MFGDFNKLSKYGELGFYEEVELTLIYLYNVNTKEYINYYSLFCFEEITKTQKINEIERKSINKNFKIGVIQYRYTLNECKRLFTKLIDSEYVITNSNVKISNKFKLLPKQFIPQLWNNKNPIINKILKPNYWGDSYILEFFDEEKDFNSILSIDDLKRIDKILDEIVDIKINLSKVSDRIGNILFQFPITILKADEQVHDDGNNISIKLLKHPKLLTNRNLKVVFKASVDECITDFKNYNLSIFDKDKKVEFKDFNNVECYIINSRNSLMYYSSKFYLLYRSNNSFRIAMGSQSEVSRHIYRDDDVKEIKYSVYDDRHYKDSKNINYLYHIENRVKNNQILSENNKNYLICNHGDEEKALAFIRTKINDNIRYTKEICLWDPYLSPVDIINTIYYANEMVICRCITDAKNLKDSDSILINKKDYQKKIFIENSNNEGIKLEFRCSYKEREDSFHDRFLIIVPKEHYRLPIVYSLGTSINGIGKKHHLIQKVMNPKIIYNAFNKLWDNLNEEKHLLIKIPEDLEVNDD